MIAVAAEPAVAVECDLKHFRDSFSLASQAVHRKSPKVVYQSVLAEAGGGELHLSGWDASIGIRVLVPGCTPDGDGRFLLPADFVRKALATLPPSAGTLSIRAEGGKVTLRAGKARWEANTEDPALHPGVPDEDGGPALALDGESFARAIRRVQFATDAESTRYALGGACLDWSEGPPVLVATDGRRLSAQDLGCPAPEGLCPHPVLPAAALKALSGVSGPLRLSFPAGKRLRAESAGMLVVAALVEGRFPRWQDILQSVEVAHRYTLDADALRSVALQAAVALPPDSRCLDFRFGGGVLSASVAGGEAGTGESSMEVAEYGEHEVTLDPAYLSQALDSVSGLEVDLECGTAKTPVLIRCDGLRHVIMPLTREG